MTGCRWGADGAMLEARPSGGGSSARGMPAQGVASAPWEGSWGRQQQRLWRAAAGRGVQAREGRHAARARRRRSPIPGPSGGSRAEISPRSGRGADAGASGNAGGRAHRRQVRHRPPAARLELTNDAPAVAAARRSHTNPEAIGRDVRCARKSEEVAARRPSNSAHFSGQATDSVLQFVISGEGYGR